MNWHGLQGEVFISCRFSSANDGNMVLYTAAVTGKEIFSDLRLPYDPVVI